jgi:uncharacterized protein (DUF2336 family)
MADVEAAVSGKTTDEREATLARVADLFLAHADRVNDEHVGVFDDVLMRLINAVEEEAKSELGRRLAPVDNAPYQTIRTLARHDDPAVAAPVLAQSARLSEEDLVEIAKSKGQDHLAAISKRPALKPKVTDALVQHGDKEVVRALVSNAGAAFSDRGFATLAARAQGDDRLVEQVGMRLDLPTPILRKLMAKASETVQQHLSDFAPLESRDEIHRIVTSISGDVVRRAALARGYADAQTFVGQMQKAGDFNESSVLEFAKMQKFEEMVVGLSLLCKVPVTVLDRLLRGARHDGLLIACKAAELKWLTVGAVLTARIGHDADAADELRKAKAEYGKLSTASARKILKFCILRENAVTKGA